MKDIATARKIVAGSGASRDEIEATILECKAAAKGDEVELAKLDEERDAALVVGGDQLKAHKATRADAEEQLATRRALVNTLEKRLEETIESARRAEMAKARALAEELLADAVGAIKNYPALREKILAILGKVKSANDAAVNFERRYTNEKPIHRAEAVTRLTRDLEEEIVSEEVVELWARGDSDSLVDERSIGEIVISADNSKRGLIPKSGISSEFAGGYPCRLRKFRRVTFLPAAKAGRPQPLVSDVQLPPLLPEHVRMAAVRHVVEPDGLLATIAEGIRKVVA